VSLHPLGGAEQHPFLIHASSVYTICAFSFLSISASCHVTYTEYSYGMGKIRIPETVNEMQKRNTHMLRIAYLEVPVCEKGSRRKKNCSDSENHSPQ